MNVELTKMSMKKGKKTSVPAKVHNIPAKKQGGVIGNALAKAALWKKQGTNSKKSEG